MYKPSPLSCLLAGIFLLSLHTFAQLPDTTLFEARLHIEGNDNTAQLTHCIHFFLDDTITNHYPFLLVAPQCPEGKRWVNTDWSLPEHQIVMPSRSIQMFDALIDAGNPEAFLVTYPELGHECWNQAFSTPGLFQWLFDKAQTP